MSKNKTPETTAMEPQIETSAAYAHKYPTIPDTMPHTKLNAITFSSFELTNNAVAAGVIINATITIEPTISNAPTAVMLVIVINP